MKTREGRFSRAQKQPRLRLWPVLLGVGLVALFLRCLYVWQLHAAPFSALRMGDGLAYHQWARRIADGDWLGQGVFYQSPVYPYFLAVIYRLLDDSVTTVRLIQAFMGAASCVLLAAAGIALFGRRGAIAGLGLAIYPAAIFLDGLIDKSALVTFFFTGLLALLCAPSDRMTARRWLGGGVLMGLLALTRENALILAFPILLWIALGPFAGGRRKRVFPALTFIAGCVLILLPVGIRNLAVGGEFHLTTAQFGPNFYIGNHAGASGTYEALVRGHGSAADEREDATRLAEQALGRKLSPGEVSSYWTGRSLDYITSQPVAWLKLMARKLALTFNALELADTESQEVYAEWAWLLHVGRFLDFGLLLGLAALGLVLTAPSWRRLWVLYALAGTYAASVTLFYVFARYRFPLVPVLVLLAAGGVIEAFDRLRLTRFKGLAVASVVAVLAVAFGHLPLHDAKRSRAPHYLGIALALAKDSEHAEEAKGFYRRVLDLEPQFPPAQLGLGVITMRQGQPEESIPYFRAAAASWPDYAEAHYNLGLALAATGRWQEAAQEYTEALRTAPQDADTHFALGKALTVMNRPDLASEHFQKVLASRPKDVKGLVGLGVVFTQMGRAEEAIRAYRLALETDPQDAAANNNLGWTLASLGRIQEAVPYFERALAIDPNYENARNNLAQARQILGLTP